MQQGLHRKYLAYIGIMPCDGVYGRNTNKALLCSSGDTNRAGTACDCSTILNEQTAQTLKSNGYQIVGRYLTGTVGGTKSKAITRAEAQIIFGAGLKFFPIYQDGGYYLDYFTSAQGNSDAIKAVKAANELGLPRCRRKCNSNWI